jgi:hypothetical protein
MGAPALLDGQAGGVLERLNDLVYWAQNQVSGGLVTDGGTTQGSGANTALNFDADVAALQGLVKGIPVTVGAASDVDSDAGISFGATSGKEVIYTVVLIPAGTFLALPSPVADTGEGVALTHDEIDALVGSDSWTLVADVTVVRTADTTVTFTSSYARRYPRKVARSRALAETEAEYRSVTD